MNSRVLAALVLLGIASGPPILVARQTTGNARTFQARLSTVPIDLAIAAVALGLLVWRLRAQRFAGRAASGS